MSTPTIGVNNPYPGVIPLSKDYRKLQAGALAKKQEQFLIDATDGDDPPSLAERVILLEAIMPTQGAPVVPVAASAVFTASGDVTDKSTVTVNNVTYTFSATITTEPNEILIGENADASLTNLTAAIMGTAGEGTTYSTGTKRPDSVTAVFNTDSDPIITCTYGEPGEIGNTIPVSVNDKGDTLSWDTEECLMGGIDGTAAPAGAIRFASDEFWISVDVSTTAESNWQKATLT